MVRKHPCPECGANLEWNAQAQALKCPYCGTTVPWSEETREELGRDVVEQDLAEALRNPKSGRGWGTEDRYEVQCQNCRAISVFVNRTVAQRCDFCGSPSIVAHEGQGDAITPQSILPFKISDGQIRDRIRQWYGSRWFAPNRLKSAALTDTLHGVYLPYWTFDAHASADWQAEAGFYYYTTESYRDSNGNVQTRQVRHVRWEPASGSLAHFFDDELVPGTVGVHANLLRQVEPFPTTTDLKPYTPEFVRGWTVERYQIDLGKAAQVNVQDMDEQLRACARARCPATPTATCRCSASTRAAPSSTSSCRSGWWATPTAAGPFRSSPTATRARSRASAPTAPSRSRWPCWPRSWCWRCCG